MTPPAGTMSIQDAGKILCSRGINTGSCSLFRQLRKEHILGGGNVPFSKYINMGWFKVKEGHFEKGTREEIYTRTFITEKGLAAIENILRLPKKESSVFSLNMPDCILGF